MGTMTIRIRDNSDEYSAVTFDVGDITALNYGTTFDPLIAGSALAELQSAIEGVILGNIATVTAKTVDLQPNDVNPGNGFAQRENGLRMYARDTDGKLHFVTIPTPDNGTLAQTGTDLVDLTAGNMPALVEALEDHWKPNNLDVVVEKGVLVGRNN